MGYLPLDDMGATIFFQLVSARYERGSIILTSNKSYGDWGSIFGDPIIATAILDRLLHHSTTINIRGESYRLKDRRKAGLFPRSEQEAQTVPFPSTPTFCRASQIASPANRQLIRSSSVEIRGVECGRAAIWFVLPWSFKFVQAADKTMLRKIAPMAITACRRR